MKKLLAAVAAISVCAAFPAWSASVTTGQVTCTTTATLIAGERTGRRAITIIQEGTTVVRLGGSTVTTGTGVPLPGTANASFTFDGGAAIYCVTASGTQLVSYVESF